MEDRYSDVTTHWYRQPDGSWNPEARDRSARGFATVAVAETGGRTVGEVGMYLSSAIPNDWAALSGGWFNYDDAPTLGALLGGSPGGQVALPNMDDRVPMGGGVPLAMGGTDTLAVGNLPPHRHTANHNHSASTGSDSHTHNINRSANTGGNLMFPEGQGSGNISQTSSAGVNSDSHSHSVTVATRTMNTGDGSDLGLSNTPFQPKHVRLVFAVYTGVPDLVVSP